MHLKPSTAGLGGLRSDPRADQQLLPEPTSALDNIKDDKPVRIKDDKPR